MSDVKTYADLSLEELELELQEINATRESLREIARELSRLLDARRAEQRVDALVLSLNGESDAVVRAFVQRLAPSSVDSAETFGRPGAE